LIKYDFLGGGEKFNYDEYKKNLDEKIEYIKNIYEKISNDTLMIVTSDSGNIIL